MITSFLSRYEKNWSPWKISRILSKFIDLNCFNSSRAKYVSSICRIVKLQNFYVNCTVNYELKLVTAWLEITPICNSLFFPDLQRDENILLYTLSDGDKRLIECWWRYGWALVNIYSLITYVLATLFACMKYMMQRPLCGMLVCIKLHFNLYAEILISNFICWVSTERNKDSLHIGIPCLILKHTLK